ncbi:cytochrome d ubiquinol oxidase subunit II [Brachybacterium saurashtrense]|uniref:Cytochrome d ubiquinol oxidase subunit II n=2 Tax=Brachybacterium saurashtrense TaxID=556288 RepID=A0A345YTD8_9MICO|nr:cytochrome d ubiquinol oxidase subunit II [Brachybacterium saurashtrense]AXK47190.1 cytochrome d ubiquinol oxidase subunit II [Brachybacterium saurashtrense]RRR22162.1 cytochrome d ubiquinol oxidase subunit II [Brachybacterium saurashtrense]
MLDPTALQALWFALIGFFFLGYFVLEGFDFGVQMNVAAFWRRGSGTRGTILKTIGPVWDGNEVWLITGGALLFAAFPEWYATLFSGFYLALLLLLLVLIVRVCAFKWRDKVDDARWRTAWDAVHVLGGFAPALLWGVAFANIVAGVGIDENRWVTTSLLGLLNPFALLGGVVFVLLFWLHGTLYLALKVEGRLREDAARLAGVLVWPTILAGAAFLLWFQFAHSNTWWTLLPVGVAAVALLAVVVLNRARREGLSFLATSTAIAAATIALFGGLFPYVMPASNDPALSLTVANASSTEHTLTVMLVALAVLMPIVIAYTIWTYRVFRHRVADEDSPAPGAELLERARKGYRDAFSQE